MNKLREEEALALAGELLSLYYSKRDMDVLLHHMKENTSWIGTGKDELSRNLEEAQRALLGELTEYNGSFIVNDTQFSYVPMHSTGGIVYGMLKATPEDSSLAEEDIRLSAILEETEDGPKLLHIHCSHADLAQEQGEHFVKQAMRGDNNSLRQELSIREIQLANLMKNIPGGVHQCVNDPSFTLISVSDGFLSMFGYSREEIETQFDGKFLNMVYPGDRAELMKSVSNQLEEDDSLEVEYRVLCKTGQPMWVLDKGRLIKDGEGDCCLYCLLVDITERKRQEEELRLSLERHQVIMDQATDIIFEWNILKDTLEFSYNFKKKFGYDAIDSKISGRIPISDDIHMDDMPYFIKLMKDTAAGVPYSETEFRIRDGKGGYIWCRVRATTQFNSDGQPIKAIGVIVDIDQEKKQRQELIAQAQHDILTGIYNKATINATVEQRMRKKNRQGSQALMIIDIDHFKQVNDTYGHLCGDAVLTDVAAALKGCTGTEDQVGRIGGDEFMVYMPEVDGEAAVRQKAERILEAVGCIHPELGAPPIGCSIGAAVMPCGCVDYQTLYGYADSALYQQKNAGRGGASFWEDQTEASISAVGNTIVSDEGNVTDGLAQYIFRILYGAKDTEATIERLLEIIGRSFDVSRAYIFESSEDGKCCSNTFEWCGDGVTPQIHELQNIAYVDELGDYLRNFDEHGIFYCHDIESLHPDVYAVLEPQGIRSMLQCAMLDEGNFVGYIGFDECRENRSWSEPQMKSFKLTADVLSIFLIKLREKQRNKK